MKITVEVDEDAITDKALFDKAVSEMARQMIISKMVSTYHEYKKTDAFCQNVLLIEDSIRNGFISGDYEKDLEKLNRQLNMDWMQGV